MGGVIRRRGGRIYRVFDHTADLGLEIYGRDRQELFVHAARALFDTITDLSTVKGVIAREVAVSGADLQDLFINYLRELLGWFHGGDMIVKDVAIAAVTETRVAGTARGERFDAHRHPLRREVKAVTYHMAQVAEYPGGWRAKVVLDV